MIFEKSWNHWMREAGRGHITAFLVWGMFLIYTGSTITQLRFFSEYTFFGVGSRELLYISAGLGLAVSLYAFSYLFQRKKQDFYYSLPVKKRTIFISRYVHGVLQFTGALTVSMFACGIFQAAIDEKFLPCASQYTTRSIFFYWLIFLLFYNIGTFSAVICGRFLSSVCIMAGILLYFYFFIENVGMVFSKCFFQAFYRNLLLENAEIFLVPFYLSRDLIGTGALLFDKAEVLEYVPSAGTICAAVLWNAVLLSVSAWLYHKRKTEGTGKVFVFPAVERIVEILASLLAGTGISGLTAEISSVSEGTSFYKYVEILLIGATVAAAVHLLLEWVILFPGKGLLRRKRQLLAEMTAVTVLILIFPGMASTYDSCFPSEEETAAVSVALGGLDMPQEDYLEVKEGKEGYTTEQLLSKYRLSEEGKAAVFFWLEKNQIVPGKSGDYTKEQRHLEGQKKDGMQNGETVQNDEYTGQNVSCVTLQFCMKNGMDKYRTYPVSLEEFRAFAFVYETEEYLQKAYPAICRKQAEKAKVTWTDGVTEQVLKLSDAEKEQLLKKYREDVLSMKLADLEDTHPTGFLKLEFEIDRENERMVIYPFFKETCAFLSQKGVAVGKTLSDYKIVSLKLTETQPAPENTVGKTTVHFYEEPEEIEERSRKIVPKIFDLQPVLYPLLYSQRTEAEIEDEDTLSVHAIECYGCE